LWIREILDDELALSGDGGAHGAMIPRPTGLCEA
jgi:hypothetical protein